MAYMGQILKSPVLNKIASQVKRQDPVRTEWAQGWESLEDAEQKPEAQIGALSSSCLPESSSTLHSQ